MGTGREDTAVALNLSGTNLCLMHRPPNRGMANKPFRATYIWSSIISHLQTQVEVKRRRHNLKAYDDCFLGSEAVDVILEYINHNKFFGDDEIPRAKVVRVCQALMEYKVFEPVGTRGFGKDKKQPTFEDSSCSLYRFLNVQNHSTDNQENGCDSTVDPKIFYRMHARRKEEPVCLKSLPLKPGKSLENLLENNVNSTDIQQMKVHTELSQTVVNEVWWEQTVLRLLQLVELPLLDSLLESRESHQPSLRSMDSDPDLLYTSNYLDREILKAFSDSQADSWISAAVDCVEFLPDQLVVEVSRGLPKCTDTPQCKCLLFEVLEKHYSQAHHPSLLSAHLFDIHTSITDLLVNGKMEQALEALQLSLNLLDSRSQEELRRLLCFMSAAADSREVRLHKEIENRMAVKRAFSRAIVHNRKHLAKGKVDLLVLFMMDNHLDIFKIPGTLHKLVSDKLENIRNGKDPDTTTGPSFCQRVTGKACRDSVQKTTEGELLVLLRTVHENPTLTSKEKKRLLGQFYKSHPEIFVQYLGNRMSTIDV